MADSALNVVNAASRSGAATVGDVPDRVRRRYLTDDRNGPGLGFYVDATALTATFRDQGHRLSTDRNDPNVVRDLVTIAQHRGWSRLDVRGATAFRREMWIVARAARLEVRGYRPTERDLQDLSRRAPGTPNRSPPDAQPAPRRDQADAGVRTRLRIVDAVVRDRIVEAEAQSRILAAARGRIADWLERGARFEGPERVRRGDKVR